LIRDDHVLVFFFFKTPSFLIKKIPILPIYLFFFFFKYTKYKINGTNIKQEEVKIIFQNIFYLKYIIIFFIFSIKILKQLKNTENINLKLIVFKKKRSQKTQNTMADGVISYKD
jgi:hypothetical protein